MTAQPHNSPAQPTEKEPPVKILIVEDEHIIAHNLKRILRTLDYDVVGPARSSSEALKFAEQTQPNLILMDINLSEAIDGIDIAAEIQAKWNIPVIYLTGYADKATLARAKVTGPLGYLLKPVEVSDLHRTIEIALYRHTMERRLRESEARYRNLFEQVPIGLFRSKLDGQILDVNPAIIDILGFPDRESLLAINAGDVYINPESREKILAQLNTHGHVEGFETQIRRYDNTIIWIRESMRAVQEKGGETVLEGSLEDITARKLVEQKLQENLEHYQLLFNSGNDAIFVHLLDNDKPGQFVEVNNIACERLGYTRQELLRLSPPDINSPHANADIPSIMKKLFAEKFVMFEHEHQHKDGQIIPVEINAHLFDLNNHPAVLSIVRDITERKKAEAAIRASEKRYRLLFNTMLNGFALHEVICDDDGVPCDYRFLEINPAFEALTGLRASDLVGKTILEVLPNTEAYWIENYGRVALTGERFSFTNYSQEFNRHYKVHAFSPQPGQFATIFDDVTEQLRAQRILKESKEELEQHVAERTAELAETNRQLTAEIVERERAQATLRRHADEQATLYKVSTVATSFLKPATLLNAVLDTIQPLLKADASWVALPDQSLDKPPQILAWHGIPEPMLHDLQSQPLHACLSCADLFTGRSTITDQTLLMLECPRLIDKTFLSQANLSTCIGVPLRVGNKILGTLHIGWAEAKNDVDKIESLLVAIGQQVGMALRNAQLYQLAQDANRLETINAIGTAAVSSLKLDDVLPQVLELTCFALDATEGSILLRDTQTDELVFAQTLSDANGHLKGQRLAPGQGIAGWAAEQRHTVRINNVYENTHWYAGMDAITGFDTQSLLCTPLLYHNNVTGVIEIVNKQHGEFTEDDTSLLEAVAAIAAVAIENAQLFSTTQTRVNELRFLHEIGLTLAATLDPQQVIQIALEKIIHLFESIGIALIQDYQDQAILNLYGMPSGHIIETNFQTENRNTFNIWMRENQQPLIINDVQNDPRWLTRAQTYAEQYIEKPVQSIMLVPLHSAAQYLGYILIGSDKNNAYNDDNMKLLQTLATTIVTTLENARLHNNLRQALDEQEHTQAQLIQAEKMSALGRLAASIAHEINNPLQAVLGCMRLSQEEVAGRFRKEKLDQHLDIAVTEVKRVSEIVHQMQDFYRQARAELVPMKVPTLINNVLALSSKKLQHSGIILACDCPENLPAIEANPDHLKQVFLNLVINAIDAMPDGGTLGIQARLLEEPMLNNGTPTAMEIVFSDTGVGMDVDVQGMLFEPFFTTKEHGSGLGLSISYGIIQAHHGTLTVDSQPGNGATFTISLPLTQPG